jgi:hypothetical protein
MLKEYISDYSHWGYADVDVLMGRTKPTKPFITDRILETYDTYTISFGDNNRYYMRGQLSIFKNNNITRNLWRKCYDLEHIGKRLNDFFTHSDPTKRMAGWHFESAEGCISRVVAMEKGLLSWSTSALISDAFRAPTSDKETLIIGAATLRCYEKPISMLPKEQVKKLVTHDWYLLCNIQV